MSGSSSVPVVLDSGTGSIKLGFAGDNFPSHVIPTIIGRPVLRTGAQKNTTVCDAGGSNTSTANKSQQPELKDLMLGDEVTGLSHLLEISAPVKNGVVRQRNDMCLLWNYAFDAKLKIDPKEKYLSVSEAPIASSVSRHELFEIMFEKFGFAGLQCTPQGVLSLYSAGLTTGIAVDSGDGVTQCSPIFDGYCIKRANRRVDLGGHDVTQNLVRLMQRRGYSFHSTADFELARAIKEQFCYAAVDWHQEKRLSDCTTVLEKSMTLPDGSTCTIGAERFEAAECLFDPSRVGIECDGLSTQIWKAIQASDVDVRTQLYQNVILAGGSTMFPGLPSRIERDVRQLYFENTLKGDKSRVNKLQIQIHDAPRRKHMVFLGCACYAELTQGDPTHWMTAKQYKEGGNSLVDRMFGQSM